MENLAHPTLAQWTKFTSLIMKQAEPGALWSDTITRMQHHF